MKRITRFKKRTWVLLGVVAVIAAMASLGAYAYFTNSGTATDTAAASVGSVNFDWSITFGTTTYAGDGCPGCVLQPTARADANKVVATVPFTITNTEESNQHLASWKAEIDGTTLPAGCSVSDFSVGDGPVSDPYVSNGLGVTLLPASDAPSNAYDDSVTIQMIDDGTSQDACQGATPDLTITAKSVDQ